MDDLKRCSKCKNDCLKTNFYKERTKKDGFRPECKICVNEYNKNYYNENRDSELERCKKYRFHNRGKINEYKNNKYKTDINFRLIKKTRNRLYHALNGKSKSSSTREILGIDIETYKKWTEIQMTPDKTWENIEIDHVKSICMFDVSKEEELREAFSWKNTQPLLKQDHPQKGIKFNFLDYQLQFIKAYQFIKLNEEKFNEKIH